MWPAECRPGNVRPPHWSAVGGPPTPTSTLAEPRRLAYERAQFMGAPWAPVLGAPCADGSGDFRSGWSLKCTGSWALLRKDKMGDLAHAKLTPSQLGPIAIVEDDPAARRMMRFWVEQAGY